MCLLQFHLGDILILYGQRKKKDKKKKQNHSRNLAAAKVDKNICLLFIHKGKKMFKHTVSSKAQLCHFKTSLPKSYFFIITAFHGFDLS